MVFVLQKRVMLRKLRIFFASLFFVGVSLLFLDVAGAVHRYLGWMAKVQFLPAMLALNGVALLVVLLLTLLVGRLYCSVICPLGVMQDLFSHMGGWFMKKRFHYARPHKVLRYVVLALFAVALVAGLGSLATLIAPYSAFGRIASTLMRPLYILCNNGLAAISAHFGSYLFYPVEVVWHGGAVAAVAVVTLLVVAMLALRYGRLWCNTVCPVGTLLGLVSRFSFLKVAIDADKCRNCGRCEKRCKSMCIDLQSHSVDASRCVACMDCLDECRFDALSLRHARPKAAGADSTADGAPANSSRRKFLAVSAAMATGAAFSASAKLTDGGLAVIEDKRYPQRRVPLKPFGAQSMKHFSKHCTACLLCVSECPNHLLRPSQKLESLMQPEMHYEQGYCPTACTRCSQVCPTGAIRPLDTLSKTSVSIGYAVTVLENCLSFSQGVGCGSCERHCPAGAVRMVADGKGRLFPSVNENRCLGCGACEYYCPARPFAAIFVEGREVHTSV